VSACGRTLPPEKGGTGPHRVVPLPPASDASLPGLPLELISASRGKVRQFPYNCGNKRGGKFFYMKYQIVILGP